MDSLYQAALKKRPMAGLGGTSLYESAMTPEVDFSKDTMMEQAPESKSFEEVGGEDMTGKAPAAKMDYKSGGVAAAKSAAKGGSAMDVAGAGLMATGHPAAMAAGLGLMTISGAQKAKQAKNEQKYKEAVARAEAKRSSLETLSGLGQRLAV
jgi:hypothetical protein